MVPVNDSVVFMRHATRLHSASADKNLVILHADGLIFPWLPNEENKYEIQTTKVIMTGKLGDWFDTFTAIVEGVKCKNANDINM